MGRRKSANPQRKATAADGGATEQLGALAVDDDEFLLPIIDERSKDKREVKLPPPNKRRRIMESDDEDDETQAFPSTMMDDESTVPDDPEVSFESVAGANGKNQWTIQVAHASGETEYVPCNSEWTLRGYRLYRTRLGVQE